MADEFQVHGGLIARPAGLFLGIDAECFMSLGPIHQRLEPFIPFTGAIKEGGERDLPIFQTTYNRIQVLRGCL